MVAAVGFGAWAIYALLKEKKKWEKIASIILTVLSICAAAYFAPVSSPMVEDGDGAGTPTPPMGEDSSGVEPSSVSPSDSEHSSGVETPTVSPIVVEDLPNSALIEELFKQKLYDLFQSKISLVKNSLKLERLDASSSKPYLVGILSNDTADSLYAKIDVAIYNADYEKIGNNESDEIYFWDSGEKWKFRLGRLEQSFSNFEIMSFAIETTLNKLQRENELPKSKYKITGDFHSGGTFSRTTVVIENLSGETFKSATAYINIYDVNGVLLDTTEATTDTWLSRKKNTFEGLVWWDITKSVMTYEVKSITVKQ